MPPSGVDRLHLPLQASHTDFLFALRVSNFAGMRHLPHEVPVGVEVPDVTLVPQVERFDGVTGFVSLRR